jgi:hypothetical protein
MQGPAKWVTPNIMLMNKQEAAWSAMEKRIINGCQRQNCRKKTPAETMAASQN